MGTTKKTEQEQEQRSDLFVVGSVVRAFFGSTRKDNKEKYRLTVHNEDLDYTIFTAFDGSPARYVPGWFKDQKGYINLSSDFDIPVRYKGKKLSFDEWVGDATELVPPNSIICVRIRQKQGAVYPVAIDIREDGYTEDVWAGFDDVE